MQLLENKTTEELVKSLLGEVAKSKNEINTARNDIEKALNRLSFSILLINKIMQRIQNNID